MMGTSSSTMISQTSHYSTFTVEAAYLPVSVDALVSRWCDGSFYRGYDPIAFIRKGVETYKPAGADKTDLLSYLSCEKFAELGSDLYELINKPVGFQRNLNLIENLFFVSEFYNRMNAKRESGTYAAVRNGLELRSAIAALYTATTSYNRSATLADLSDPSMIPLSYSGNAPKDYTAEAGNALGGNTEIYAATKKEMMIFANYITTSSKGPDFSSVETVLTPDQLVCAWFNPDTLPQNCSKVYTLNSAGHVTLGGTEVSVAEANAVFTKFFMPMNSRLTDEEKLSLFRTFYLALKYAGTIFYNGSDVSELHDALLETAYLVFDGINGNMNAVTITDTFDASAHTVAVLDGAEMAAVPYLTKLSSLTDQISLKVAAASADVEKVIISIEGKEFEKVQENTRTYYKPVGNLKEKSIVLTPGTLAQGEKALKELIGSENVDSLGNITGKMTIVANSKISGKTYTAQKSYDFFVNNDSDGVNSKEVPANIQIFVNDSNGNAVPDSANPTIILNPGSRVYYPENGVISLENLTPAAYTIDAFADGYYAKQTSVNVPAGATFSVEIRLDEELTSTADANLELSININTAKHPSKVYIQIYNDDMDLVANEAAKFNESTNTYETLDIGINSGRYTLLAVGEDMYRYLEAITLYEGNNTKEITVVAKNACGNGIVDSAEECEPSVEGSTLEVLCGEIYPASTYPEKSAVCDPESCTFNKTECGKAALCGDGIIDRPSEACDGGSKACAEIAGFGNSTGSAPCASDCSGYITANNCMKATESCGSLPANALWNDGEGTFAQTYNGESWLPATKTAVYGNTKEECVFSCAKGYRWEGSACLESPLSLALICTGADSCSDSTNETECPAYGTSFFGQDAQYAQAAFCTPHKLTAAGNGIVKDAYTHYEWQASSSTAMSWSAANDYCSHLNDESGSSSLWRIPGPAELLTIVDSGTASPALGGMFTTSEHTFWATEDAKVSGNAWMLDENGALRSVDKAEANSVICVRTNDYDAPVDRFTAETETVKDADSGLMWQKQPVASRTWAEALSYCEEVSTADKFDWRLPNRNELASLLDYTEANGAMSSFPGIAAKGFWTSTASTSSATEAWTVDFADGKIEASDKTNTKYIICVRNDEPCFGDECADPCSFNACRADGNSTGLCTASDYSFTCGCKSGFNWNHGKCLLDTTRYTACTGLPENAIWNTVFGISQTYDGDKWYPSEVGTFNKIASSTECRFICATNYKWDADEEKCLPVSRMTGCSEKKPYSDWNVVSKISQTWDGEKWVPSATSVYNTEPSEDECRFVCKENYTWDNANKLCQPEKRQSACNGLPANASWHYETIEQTWNGTTWAPTTNGTHSTGAIENECHFKCNEHYTWRGSACAADEQYNIACNDQTLPDNAEWNQYNQINQTWSGTEWLPTTAGSYNETPDPAYCRFKCKANYNWNCTSCDGATKTADCEGLPANAVWNVASSITQKYTGFTYTPSTEAEYCDTPSTENCCFKCLANYNLSNDGSSCEAATRLRDCTGLPANAEWNTGDLSGQITQRWNGTEWAPALTGTYGTTSNPEKCIFKCLENYEWKGGLCVAKKESALCKGLPANAMWNEVASIVREWQGNAWDISTKGEYSEEPSKTECRYKCKENFTWDGSKCRADTRIADCLDRPANSVWNETAAITQTWNGKEWMPKLEPEYSYSPSDTECKYICDTGYYHVDGKCVADPCNIDGVNPCSGVEHSTGVCETADNIFIPYRCECETGYNWWGKTGCRRKEIASGNICTGLDRCYDNDTEIVCPSEGEYFYGQDAQYAETGYCAPRKFTAKETIVAAQPHKTVIDENTKLEWLYDGAGYGTWYEAFDYCDNLNYAGHSDWRLPSIKELMTLIEYNREWRLPLEFSDSGWQNGVWSGTDDPADQEKAFYSDGYGVSKLEDLNYGYEIEYRTKTNTNHSYICVRGSGLSEGSFEEIDAKGDGTEIVIKDSTTNLYWQKTPVHKNWRQAFTYCENLVYGGYDDWRLPNINELYSIADYTLYDPAVSPFFEIDGWDQSSTTMSSWNEIYYAINFVSGLAYNTQKSDNSVHCVRSDLCDEGTFWDGKNCAVSPCAEDSCTMEHSDGICKPLSSSKFECGCADGYRWNDSSESCVKDPCLDNSFKNKCASMRGSDGVCTIVDETHFTCGCTEGYFWSISSCRKKAALGSICTGLTKCYNYDGEITCPEEGEDFYGQDAIYAAKGACVPKSFRNAEIDGDEVVIDNNTGIIWQKYASEETYTFNNAIGHCADLEYAGYTDWRLPNPPELISILEFGEKAPIDTGYFPAIAEYEDENHGWHTDYYMWGSTSNPASKAEAFNVYLPDETKRTPNSSYFQKTKEFHVRCVRGDAVKNTLTTWTAENGDEVLVETESGLMLNPATTSDGAIWGDKLDSCENYNYAGYTDWRMANLYEAFAFADFPPMSFGFGTSTRDSYYPAYLFSTDSSFQIWRGDAEGYSSGLCVRSGNVPADFRIDGEQLNMTCGEIFECINNKCPDNSLSCIENCTGNSTKAAQYQYQDFEKCVENNLYQCYGEAGDSAGCILSACAAELESCFANSGEGPHCMSNYQLCYSTEPVDTNRTCLDITQCIDACGDDRGCQLACEYYSTEAAKIDYENIAYYRDNVCSGAADFEGCMIVYVPYSYDQCYGETDNSCNELFTCAGICNGDTDCIQECHDNATETGNNRYYAIFQCLDDNSCSYESGEDYSGCLNSNCWAEAGACFNSASGSKFMDCSQLLTCTDNCNGDTDCEYECHYHATIEGETEYSSLQQCYDNYNDFCADDANPEECLNTSCQTEYNTCYGI